MNKLLAVIILLIAFIAPVAAQELERIGEWGTPPYHHIEKNGTTLYALSENGWLDVIDITEPELPVRGMRMELAGTPYQMLLHGDRAYISSGWAGILILDITNPAEPVLLKQQDLGIDVRHLTILENTMYLSARGNGVGIMDFSDPDNPQLLSTVSEFTIDGEVSERLGDTLLTVTNGSSLFISDAIYGLVALDISDRRTPAYQDYVFLGSDIQDILIYDDVLIVGLGASGVSLYDISDMSDIVQLSNFTTQTADLDDDGVSDYTYRLIFTYNLVRRGDLLYVADGAGFDVLDISDTAAITTVHDYDTPFLLTDILLDGDRMYGAESINGLSIYDISNTEESTFISAFNDGGYTLDMVVSGDQLITCDLYRGVRVLDITDRANPEIRATVNAEGIQVGAVAIGNYLYVANTYQGVMVYDLSDTENPELITTVPTGGVPQTIIHSGDQLLVPTEWGGMTILSIENPEAPEFLASYQAGGYVYNGTVAGDMVALASGFAGMELVSLADAGSPQYLGTLDTAGIVTDVLIHDEIAFVADFYAGLYVVDISTPTDPVLIHHLPEYFGADELAVLDGLLYVVRGTLGMDRIDITDVDHPVQLDMVETEDNIRDLFSADGYLYVGEGNSGRILVYRTSEAAPVAVPHIPAGRAWSATLSLTNGEAADAMAMVTIFDKAAPVYSVPVRVPAGSTVEMALPEAGCAQVTRLGGQVTVNQTLNGPDERAVNIPLDIPAQQQTTLELDADTLWTGVALMNNDNRNRSIQVTALGAEDMELETVSCQLGPIYRNAWLLHKLFPSLNTADILKLRIQSEGRFSALAIWESADGKLQAAVPAS